MEFHHMQSIVCTAVSCSCVAHLWCLVVWPHHAYTLLCIALAAHCSAHPLQSPYDHVQVHPRNVLLILYYLLSVCHVPCCRSRRFDWAQDKYKAIRTLEFLYLCSRRLEQASVTPSNWIQQSWTICTRAEDLSICACLLIGSTIANISKPP